MSNLTKLQNFKLISSPNFINVLEKIDLPIEEYNFLLATHILAIAYNSTGICDGSFKLNYITHMEDGKFSNPQPEPNFAFYTTKYNLIEENKPSTYSIRINNKNFPKFRNAFTFKKFFIEYFNQYSKEKTSDNKLTIFTPENKLSFRMNPKHRFQETEQISGYTQLIENNPIMEKLLTFNELQNTLKQKSIILKSKTKI